MSALAIAPAFWQPLGAHGMISGMSNGNDDERRAFDQASTRIAQAWACGDARAARREADLLVARQLMPRLRRLAGALVFDRNQVDDAVAFSLLRIATDWQRGKAVTWLMLRRIVVNCAVDLERRGGNIPLADVDSTDPDAWEAFLAAEGTAPRRAVEFDDVELDIEVQRLVAELRGMRMDSWVAVVRAWHEGYHSGSDIEHSTGIPQGRVRQLKMDICAFLRHWRPHLRAWFGCLPKETLA